jgi:hypothetical protein
VLIGTDPAVFLDGEPDLAAQVVEWFNRRRRINRFHARDLARPLVASLEKRRRGMWEEKARRLLAAQDDIADEHPRLCRLAAVVATGHLASPDEIAALDDPPAESRTQIQQAVLGDFYARRANSVDDE